ncbi:rubredoxin [Persephonella sp.]|uniref:rubredoxin n=1 Tax=Persephonella sp. TaxID=2060922 RepID=UPI0025F8A1B7|nr:rubredoxin [Persephonella sp.]
MEKKVIINNSSKLKYRCKVCGYIYDPDKGDEKRGISPTVQFEDLPDKWRCPVCNYTKSHFYQVKDGYRQEI